MGQDGGGRATLVPLWKCFLHVPVMTVVSMLANLPESSYLEELVRVSLIIGTAYFGVTGALWLVFYSPLSFWGAKARRGTALFPQIGRKIQPSKRYTWAQAQSELIWSACTVVTGASLVAIVTWLHSNGYSNLYWNVGDYGWAWLVVSGALMVVFNDAWMYWGHYYLHSPAGFRGVHKVHHMFFAPTPFSTMAFHPLEAIVMFGPVVGAIFFPMHIPLLLAVSSLFFLVSIFEHLGWTLPGYDSLDSIVSTPIHHDLHHSLYKCNYGVYLCFWDRIMGTLVEESHHQES